MLNTVMHTLKAYAKWCDVALRSRLCLGAVGKRPSTDRIMLLLAWRLPPSVTGGVYRPSSFLKYGKKNGWEISAIAGPPELVVAESGQWLLERIPASARIFRVDKSRLCPAWNWFPRVDGNFLNALSVSDLAFRELKRCRPSVVLASGPPFHNFIAAFYVARYFGAKLVLDYRDEWSIGTRDFIRLGNVDRKWELFCLKRASAIIFATNGFKEIYLRNFPELDAEKICVVTNGWDADDFSELDGSIESVTQNEKRYVISFVGRCGKFLGPDSFLTTLDRLLQDSPSMAKRVRVRFVGRQFPEALAALKAFSEKWPDVLELMGELSKPDALRAMKESSCLLLLNNAANERVRAGKIYEYIAAGPPVLLYGNGKETEELILRLRLGPVVPENESKALGKVLSELMEGKWQSNKRPDIDAWLTRHTREALAARVFEIAENCSLGTRA